MVVHQKQYMKECITMPEFKDYTFVWAFGHVDRHTVKEDERTLL